MKKVALLAILILAIATPVMGACAWAPVSPAPAGWKVGDPIPMVPKVIKPIVGGVAQVLDIAPDTIPLVDGAGKPVYDPLTGKQKVKRTWTNYMWGICNGNVQPSQVILQGIKLQKYHPIRKSACDPEWNQAENWLLEQGIEVVAVKWPLLYEVHGVRFILTITYNTTVKFGYPGYNGSNSKSHTEQYEWDVIWNAKTVASDFPEFRQRLNYFKIMPAGVCEWLAVTPRAIDGIEMYLNGFGVSPADTNWIDGVFQLWAAGNMVGAQIRLEALMGYIGGICGPCPTTAPDPVTEFIIDNATMPVASLLVNDLWAAGANAGILTD